MIDGMGTGFTRVRLNGRGLAADITNAIVGDPQLTRTMEGASELTFTVSDPHGNLAKNRIVREASRITIDSLKFALVKTAKQGPDLTLTFEDELIHRLRHKKGPKKAYRDKTTRALFVRSLVKEVDPDAKFICPELRKEQPIADGKRPGRTVEANEVDEQRESGIPRDATGLTVKGARATRTQKRVAEEIITAAMAYNPPRRALVALLCAVTVESVMGTVGMTPATITDHDSVGILQARLMYVSAKNAMSIPYNVRRFLVGPSWTGAPAAIRQVRHGNKSIVDICRTIQGCDPQYAYRYGQYFDEANRWIDAYNGGTIAVRTTITKRFAFQVGKKEDYWSAIKRLADEVGWRVFVVRGSLYFIAEPTLFSSRRRVWMGAHPSGVDDIDWDCDTGKKSHSATVTARAKTWMAPPGTVVGLSDDHGPAAGRWLVASIDGTLINPEISITLKRPAKPKPEPKSESVTKTRRIPGDLTGTGGAERAVKWAKRQVGVTEGSSKYNKWMNKLGRPDEAWCSDWIAYLMKYICGFRYIPSNFPDSICWASWGKATQVSVKNIQPGDIVMYSGAHVALYIGGGRCISGNYSSAVTQHGLRDHPSPISNVARPHYR